MNTAYSLHPHADASRAKAHTAPCPEMAAAESEAVSAVMPPARTSAAPYRAAEIAALFAVAALSVIPASAAPAQKGSAAKAADAKAAPVTQKALASTSAQPGEGPLLTSQPMPMPASRPTRITTNGGNSIVVRRSTRVTRPSLEDTPAEKLAATPATEPRLSYSSLPRLESTPYASRFITQRLASVRAVKARSSLDLSIPALPAKVAAAQPVAARAVAAAQAVAPHPVAALPAAPAAKATPVSLEVDGSLPAMDVPAALQPMGKVITVSALKLPPASAPLPKWSPEKIVRADSLRIAPSLPGAKVVKANGRVAQNTATSPLKQPARPVTNSDRLPNQLEVSVGTFVVLLTTSDLSTVAVADPNTADVAVVSSRAVLVNGKTPGVTSLVIVDRNRIRQYQIRVTPAIGTRSPDVAAAIGLPGVSVRPLRDALVLEGEVETLEEARRAVEIANVFSPKVINQLSVRGTPTGDAAIATQIQSAINVPGVTVRNIGDTLLLEGSVENAVQRQRAETIATRLSKNVLNLIELPRLQIEQVRETLNSPDSAAATASGEASGITVRQVGDQIILEGQASSPDEVAQAVATAARTGLQVVNRLQVSTSYATLTSEADYRRTVEAAIGMPGVKATGNNKLLVLQGTVPDSNQAMIAEHIAAAYAPQIQNLLMTPHPILVNVDVSIVEINKNNLKNLGVTYGTATTTQEELDPITRRPISRTITPTLKAGQFLGGNSFGGFGGFTAIDPFRAQLSALYTTGDARLLSNPNTTLLSGRQASFQVGGQVPIPSGSTTNQAGTSTTIVFKDFGILFDVMPTANKDGIVTMRIRTEVSQPDFSIGVTPPGGGGVVPGFSRRSTVSEFTVPPNGTIALSGLISDNLNKNITKVPVLSKIPILGSLFQSKNYQHNKSELVIFIKPSVLPNPLKEGQLAPVSVMASIDNPGTVDYGVGAKQATASALGGAKGDSPAAGAAGGAGGGAQ